MWYIKYFWVKLNIWVLTPLVWLQDKWDDYSDWRLRTYVNYQIMCDNMTKK